MMRIFSNPVALPCYTPPTSTMSIENKELHEVRGGIMRPTVLSILLTIISIPVCAQQPQSNTTTATPAPQDAQAVNILNQAVSRAGGVQEVSAVTDYSAAGSITYHGHSDVKGSVTIIGLNTTDFRLDATLATGVRSWAVVYGVVATKDEKGRITRFASPPNVASTDFFPHQTPLFPSSLGFPYRQLVAILNNPIFKISYIGTEQLNGLSVQHIRAQRTLPNQIGADEYHTRDFFIDATFKIVMTRDAIPHHIVHEVHYAGYTAVNGILVPFLISEQLGGQPTWSIELTGMAFNTGLQESAFVLQ
jgi:hypothetical protein